METGGARNGAVLQSETRTHVTQNRKSAIDESKEVPAPDILKSLQKRAMTKRRNPKKTNQKTGGVSGDSKPSGEAIYVNDRLVSNEQRIPTQPLYSDTTYWYDEKKLQDAWRNPSAAIPSSFYSPIKGDPVAFANTRPDYYSENVRQIWVQEFEFSANKIVFNSYSYGFSNPENKITTDFTLYRRDVITGEFSFKNGVLQGTARTALRGWIGRGEFENRTPAEGGSFWVDRPYESYFYTESASGVPIDSLGDLADYTSAEWLQNASAQFPENLADTITSLSDIPVETDLRRFFPADWTTTVFSSNLI